MKTLALWWRQVLSKNRIMRVVLVDDHAIVSDGVAQLLENQSNLKTMTKFTSGTAAVTWFSKNVADLLITDLNLPDIFGLDLIRKVRHYHPEIKVIVLSMHDEVHIVREVLKADVNAYVLKNDSHKELYDAISQVMNGKIYLSDAINKMLITSLRFPDENKLLSIREREILKLIAKEFSNRQIAEELFISERTVETHRKNIFRKTKTNTLVGLIKFAYANNLI
jgi:two-component system, NarL family, nitrate/nitrite response regulator NarL